MRSPVQSFPVDVNDIYEDARASIRSSQRGSRPKVWGLTAIAVCLGAMVGWYLAIDPAVEPAAPGIEAATVGQLAPITTSDAQTVAAVERPTATGSAIDAATQWLRLDQFDSTPARPLGADAWPITLHRAGDGQFYADLSLDGHIVNGRIDPGRARSTLRSGDLPGGVTLGGAEWQVSDVVLEHLRLPATRFVVTADPTAETVIGNDLLAPFFTIEERIDRLRLVPRAG
jgi:hypothetical protein